MAISPVNRAASAYMANAPSSVGPSARARKVESEPQGVEETGFSDRMAQAIDGVSEQQASADSLLAELAAGERVDLHGTMIALEKAEISLRTMVSVRDKAIAAYEQIMNMAI